MRRTRWEKKHVLRILLVLGVPLATTLLLLMGTAALHTPGSPLLSFAHAMTQQATCASTQGTQPKLCNQQNPVTQGCNQDAQSVEIVSVFTPQNALIGEVDLRHSNRCHAFWIRTIAYANTQVDAVEAILSFDNGTLQDHHTTGVQPDQRLIAFTDLSQPTVIPKMAGMFHVHGQTAPMTIPL